MRLLLVEDEKRLSDALAAILRKKGYQVDTALDGETGLIWRQKARTTF